MTHGRGRRRGGLAVLTPLLAVLVCLQATPAMAQGSGDVVSATLRDHGGVKVGQVTYHPHERGTRVDVRLHGLDLEPGFHGLHLHERPECDPHADPAEAFQSAGRHWGSSGTDHADHAGDMPPLLVHADGSAEASFATDRFQPDELVTAGVAQVVHARRDNLGHLPERYEPAGDGPPGPDEQTRATGDAGDRYACGVVIGGEQAVTAPPEGGVATGAGGTAPEIAPLPYVLFGTATLIALGWSHVRTRRASGVELRTRPGEISASQE